MLRPESPLELRSFCERQRVGWVERSDTHQLHLMEMMGFAGSTHPTYCNDVGEHRSPDGAQRNPGLTRRRPRITLRSIRATAARGRVVICPLSSLFLIFR